MVAMANLFSILSSGCFPTKHLRIKSTPQGLSASPWPGCKDTEDGRPRFNCGGREAEWREREEGGDKGGREGEGVEGEGEGKERGYGEGGREGEWEREGRGREREKARRDRDENIEEHSYMYMAQNVVLQWKWKGTHFVQASWGVWLGVRLAAEAGMGQVEGTPASAPVCVVCVCVCVYVHVHVWCVCAICVPPHPCLTSIRSRLKLSPSTSKSSRPYLNPASTWAYTVADIYMYIHCTCILTFTSFNQGIWMAWKVYKLRTCTCI